MEPLDETELRYLQMNIGIKYPDWPAIMVTVIVNETVNAIQNMRPKREGDKK